MSDAFNAKDSLKTSHGTYTIYRLDALEKAGLVTLNKLPVSIRVLLEAALRQIDGLAIREDDVRNIAAWTPQAAERPAIPFKPGRVVMQDFTGVPSIVDLAALRSAMARLGGDPQRINPEVPVDLVIDHSVQVDFFATPDALARNAEIEFVRNRERYEFLHWGQKAFDNFRVVPPATGIVHQVNLEYLADVVLTREVNGEMVAFPDTLVGTDSHTPMINGLGVVGWGVGGIEAEAAILGQAIDMLLPDVVGFRLHGQLSEGVTPTDLTLTVTQLLRAHGVVGQFVEFFGPGLNTLGLSERAMIGNMSPENGATITFFPVDDETLDYLRLTGRSDETVALVEAYYKEQGLFRTDAMPEPEFSATLELDMSTVKPSLSGPKLPHERIDLSDVKKTFHESLVRPKKERGFELPEEKLDVVAKFGTNGHSVEMRHGALVIAAITSCTNTSNPQVMIGAGLLAKKAVEKGLKTGAHVKTSMAPGSRVVTEYLEAAGLDGYLEELGFNTVGYGCTTCIGNSGPLPARVVEAVTSADLVAASVLSGNRNFEGRIHPYSLANYLASPPLVVAYALAGTVDIDLANDPIGEGKDGAPVYLKDIWPSTQEIKDVIREAVRPEQFTERYADVFTGNETWNAIEGSEGDLYAWDEASTYIQEPPFFTDLTPDVPDIEEIKGARVLVKVGDSITTDHISPAGAIPVDSPAGRYLTDHDVAPNYFNSYGSRRGNDRVMTRGTFANIRLKNQMAPGTEGGMTTHLPSGEVTTIYEAALRYQEAGTPLVALAGEAYGTGSSRDWAAKGTYLLGIKFVIARSYERIHRSNLVGMGVLPLQFKPGEGPETLGLDGSESYSLLGLSNEMKPADTFTVAAEKDDGSTVEFKVDSRLDTAIEVVYYRHGGILHKVLRDRLLE
jgi:aconitate hydratase